MTVEAITSASSVPTADAKGPAAICPIGMKTSEPSAS